MGPVAPRYSWVLLAGLASCSQGHHSPVVAWQPAPAPDLGGVVARVNDIPLYSKQVEARAKRTGKAPRDALLAVVDDCIAAEGARAQGRLLPSDQDPEVESAIVQRLTEREIEPGLRREAIPDTALRPLYDKVRERFVHPRLVEIGVLAVFTGELMKEEPRREREQVAKELATFIAKQPPASLDDFIAVARDNGWADRNVVYRRMVQGLDAPLSKRIGAEVLKLHAPGELTALLSDETGFYVARYIDEKQPENITFEQAREKLASAYHQRWSQEQFLNAVSKMAEKHKVEVHFDRVAPDEQGR
jgi:hypothetical protein